MEFISDNVAIDHIDVKDFAFKITTKSSVDDLVESINNIGLITPPILRRKAATRYSIVSGFRRIAACRASGWERVDARIISEDDNDLNFLRLAIADNALNRQLNVIEQAVAVSKLSVFYPHDDILLTKESNAVGLTINPGLIKKLKKIDSVPDALKNKIATGVIPFTIGLEMADLDESISMALLKIIEALNPTLNHQKEIIRQIKEIAKLSGVPMSQIIHAHEIDAIIDDPDLDRNQKIKKLRRRLKQIRYPEIDRFEKNYLTCLQRINLPESIALNPPADFEGVNFTMNLNFQNLIQFREIIHVLRKVQDHPDFAKILEKEFEDN